MFAMRYALCAMRSALLVLLTVLCAIGSPNGALRYWFS